MPLPAVSARETIRAFEKAGFLRIRQKGSHVVMQKKTGFSTMTLVIPNHAELARGTLRAIIRKAGISVEDFVALLR